MVGVFAIFATLSSLELKDGRRARCRDPDRRDDHPGGSSSGDEEALGRLELVAAEVARLAAEDLARDNRTARERER
jgi:hypothetical protein